LKIETFDSLTFAKYGKKKVAIAQIDRLLAFLGICIYRDDKVCLFSL
jgi:hypothetical protein